MPDDPSHPMDHIVVVLLEHRSLGILLGHQRSRASSKRAEIVPGFNGRDRVRRQQIVS
jgi:hypothetical protein